jgi:hypothetical protein
MSEKKKKIEIILLLVVTGTIMSSLMVNASQPSGYYWENEAPYMNPHRYYATTTIWGQFSTAISDWNGETDFGTLQLATSPDDAVCTVSMENWGYDDYAGWREIDHSGFLVYTSEIVLNSYWTGSLSSNEKREICNHEIGHDLGLADLWDPNYQIGWSPAQVMWANPPDNWNRGVYTPQSGINADFYGVDSIY